MQKISYEVAWRSRARTADGAQRAPSPLLPTPNVIPAKAGTYPFAVIARAPITVIPAPMTVIPA